MNARDRFLGCLAIVAVTVATSQPAFAQEGNAIKCGDPLDKKKVVKLDERVDGRNLLVTGNCVAGHGTSGKYIYGDVNIYGGGKLTFLDEVVDFWAKNIVVENNGELLAGVENPDVPLPGIDKPIGTKGGKLTIHLFGADQNNPAGAVGVGCMQKYCGIPETTWNSGGSSQVPIPSPTKADPNRTVMGFFYPYGPLMYDGGALPAGNPQGTTSGFFGYKVLAVSYGGTLRLSGAKGASNPVEVKDSGKSWVRLMGTVQPGATKIVVDREVVGAGRTPSGDGWAAGDRIVLTTTDYLPGHSEELVIKSIDADRKTINIDTTLTPIKYRHQGEVYPLRSDMGRLNLGASRTSIETRAAVGLLSRSIQIVSEGPAPVAGGFPEAAGQYFGGHTIARQGFKVFQVQGVEFKLLGQGGRVGHYPVHFHHAQDTPADTFVKDSSVNESMTRFMVLHATNGVTLARNVAWKSIGHGFYIEDGNEIDNKLQTNLAVYARAALKGPFNPREVPGILAADRNGDVSDNVPFYTDVDHPTLFWIMNSWNDFEYNMAAGAGMCGACYWLLAGANSGHSRHEPMASNLAGYSALQVSLVSTTPGNIFDFPLSRAGLTPLRKFVGNSCTGAMNSFNTVGNTAACVGSGFDPPFIPTIQNPFNLPKPCDQFNPAVLGPPPDNKIIGFKPEACANAAHMDADMYYPKVSGTRNATVCDPEKANCRDTIPCAFPDALGGCAVTVIDQYTSSFHMGAETNFGAIWLRGPSWFLITNSALTDTQNAGLTIISGGGYTSSDALPGRWVLARKTVFVGSTQDDTLPGASGFASAYGPFNPKGGLPADGNKCSGNHCLSIPDGISVPVNNFVMSQRMFNIYDGPAYQDSNAYLDIRKLAITDCALSPNGAFCNSTTLAGRVLGLPFDASLGCHMPNAAIAWKQPNGFYYPPAFHSLNLYFDDGKVAGPKHKVDIRHFVIEPLFTAGTYDIDLTKVKQQYCNWSPTLFNGYTDVDRQTELSDDDGSLTGYQKTVSVNNDEFFNAPTEVVECESDSTAKTSPYDYVTSVVYPACARTGTCCVQGAPCDKAPRVEAWDADCANEHCYGVKLYRQLQTSAQEPASFIRMGGQRQFQRSTLSANNGVFYVDTTVSAATQKLSKGITSINEFREGQVYYLFLLYATPDTTQKYQIYVGDNFNKDDAEQLWATRAVVTTPPTAFNKIDDWPAEWTKEYANGILTVTLKMKFDGFNGSYKDTFQDICKPATFCSWTDDPNNKETGGTCGCKKDGDFAAQCSDLNNSKQDVCAAWAQKSFDCPKDGCFGIGFKMAKMTYDVNKRPAPTVYPPGPPWTVPWKKAVGGIAQSCTPP